LSFGQNINKLKLFCSGAAIGGVDPTLAAATLNGGSSNLTGANDAWELWDCWANRGGALDIAADKQIEENEKTKRGEREKGPVKVSEKSSRPASTGQWMAKRKNSRRFGVTGGKLPRHFGLPLGRGAETAPSPTPQ